MMRKQLRTQSQGGGEERLANRSEGKEEESRREQGSSSQREEEDEELYLPASLATQSADQTGVQFSSVRFRG